jgi:peptidoglycan hydrolase-like protein with peptidoglycan-binding domain
MTETGKMTRVAGFGAAAAAVAVASCLWLSAVPARAADEVNGATIQWAQTILEEKGFYNGRATSRMDAATTAAISAFQRKSGLKASGRLDGPTIEKLKEGRTESKTVGNLADPASRARHSSPMLREEEVKPNAAPAAAGVEAAGSAEGQSLITGIGSGRHSEPAPAAAPHTALQAAGPDPAAAPPSPVAAERAAVETEGGGGIDLSNLTAPEWARYGLLGFVALLVGGMGLTWWSSGRRRRPAPRRGAPPAARGAVTGDGRREPVFGGKAGPDGRVEPTLRAVPGGGPGPRGGRL